MELRDSQAMADESPPGVAVISVSVTFTSDDWASPAEPWSSSDMVVRLADPLLLAQLTAGDGDLLLEQQAAYWASSCSVTSVIDPLVERDTEEELLEDVPL